MKTVIVRASKTYEVRIGAGLLDTAGAAIRALPELQGAKVAVIVSDDRVFPLYGERLKSSLASAGLQSLSFVFPHGERSKNLQTYAELLNMMCEAKVSRSDLVVALGGGVVGDLAGFAAASYQRGIGFVQLPTSLLAAVDSSVGGKTAVDLPGGKNQVGAFYQPSLVLCDTDCLSTLPEEEYRNGCGEIIKYAMIGSRALFDTLKKAPVSEQYESVIEQCVAMKRDFVEQDERDVGCRMLLNFGHTIGHAVETCSHYSIPHGQAVAIGMAAITNAAASKGICKTAVAKELLGLLEDYRLPTVSPYGKEALLETMLTDKKRSGDRLRLILPLEIGKTEIQTVSKEELSEYLPTGGTTCKC